MKKFTVNIAKGKRVSAAEAADILGVPRYAISRIDRQGSIIERYKLGHRTHVYDLESLYQYLSSRQVTPAPSPTIDAIAGLSSAARKVKKSDAQKFTLKDLLPQKEKR